MAVFISYSHQDAAVVEPLALQLVKQNVKVWRHVWRNAVGEDFVTAVRDALAGASSACIFISSNSLQSAWVTEETRMALERAAQDLDFLIIPIRLDDSVLPVTLKDRIAVDYRHDHDAGLREVLAAIDTVENRPPKGRLKLEGSYYIHFGIARFTIADADGQPQVEANLRITTLGSGPSDSLVFNGGALFEQICRASGISLNVDEARAL